MMDNDIVLVVHAFTASGWSVTGLDISTFGLKSVSAILLYCLEGPGMNYRGSSTWGSARYI